MAAQVARGSRDLVSKVKGRSPSLGDKDSDACICPCSSFALTRQLFFSPRMRSQSPSDNDRPPARGAQTSHLGARTGGLAGPSPIQAHRAQGRGRHERRPCCGAACAVPLGKRVPEPLALCHLSHKPAAPAPQIATRASGAAEGPRRTGLGWKVGVDLQCSLGSDFCRARLCHLSWPLRAQRGS